MKRDNGIKTGDLLPKKYGIVRNNFGIEEKNNGEQN
jgi:hypothetical protein